MTNHVPSNAARQFWNEAYCDGTRIVVEKGQLCFLASTDPLLRIMNAGNRFGVFPDPVYIVPSPPVAAGCKTYADQLIPWLSVKWPHSISRFQAHVLVSEHELEPLIRYAASIGEHVDGRIGRGGWVPIYYGKIEKRGSYTPRQLPEILKDYGQVVFG